MAVVVPPRSQALAPFVASLGYYESDLPSRRERILPSGSTSLMINLHEDELWTYDGPSDDANVNRVTGAALGGPNPQYGFIHTREQRHIVSVNFRVGGAYPFFRAPISESTDQLVGLDDLWGRDGAVLRERMLEASSPVARLQIVEDTLIKHATDHLEPDRTISYAANALDAGCSVADVADRLGWLHGRLMRRFRTRVGLTPKRYGRIRRLQRTLAAVVYHNDIDWAQAAATNGYYDQAHLINDFRELTGLTPTSYQPRNPSEHNHVPL